MASRVHPRLREPVLLLSHLHDGSGRAAPSLSALDGASNQPRHVSDTVRQRQQEAIEENSRSMSDGDEDDNQPKLFSVGSGALPPPAGGSVSSRLASAGRTSREVSPRSVSPSAPATSMMAPPHVPMQLHHRSHTMSYNAATSSVNTEVNSGAAFSANRHGRRSSPPMVTSTHHASRDDDNHFQHYRTSSPSTSSYRAEGFVMHRGIDPSIPRFVALEDIADDPKDEWEEEVVEVVPPSTEEQSATGELQDGAKDLDGDMSSTHNQHVIAWQPPPEIGHLRRYFEPALTPPRHRPYGSKTFPSPLTEIHGTRYHDPLPHDSLDRRVVVAAAAPAPLLERSVGSTRRAAAQSVGAIADESDPIPRARPVLTQRPEPKALLLDVTVEQFLEKTSRLLNHTEDDATAPPAAVHSPKRAAGKSMEERLETKKSFSEAVVPAHQTNQVSEASSITNNKTPIALKASAPPVTLLQKQSSSSSKQLSTVSAANELGPSGDVQPTVVADLPKHASTMAANSGTVSQTEAVKQEDTSPAADATSTFAPQQAPSSPPSSPPPTAQRNPSDGAQADRTPEEALLEAPVVQSREASSPDEDVKTEAKTEPLVSHRGESSRSHQGRPSLRERAAAKRQTRKSKHTTSPSRVGTPPPRREAPEGRTATVSQSQQAPLSRSNSARRILEVPPRSMRRDGAVQRSGSVVLLPPPPHQEQKATVRSSSSSNVAHQRPEVPLRRPSLSSGVGVERNAPPPIVSKRAAACSQGTTTSTSASLGSTTFQSSGSIRISAPPPPAIAGSSITGGRAPVQSTHSATAAAVVPSRDPPRRLPIVRKASR